MHICRRTLGKMSSLIKKKNLEENGLSDLQPWYYEDMMLGAAEAISRGTREDKSQHTGASGEES